MLVTFIDKICKILRRSITGSRCIITGYLISPGTVKRILGNTHQLNMCISHLLHIRDQIFHKIPITVKSVILSARMAHPGSRMYLVDRHRFCIDIFGLCTLFHPFFIGPLKMLYIRDGRCRSRTKLCIICIWIRLIEPFSIFRLYQVFIQCTFLDPRNKQFEYSHGIRL